MKRFFLFVALVGLFSLTSCGSTESCRSRQSAYKNVKTNNPVNLVSTDSENTVK